MNEKIKIVGVAGSLRNTSFTQKAIKLGIKYIKEMGVDAEFINIADYDLPFVNQYDGREMPEDVMNNLQKLVSKIKEADGLLVGSPEYHGTLSGVIKNFFDLLSDKELGGKLIGLIGVSGGALGGPNALEALRVVARTLYAWVLPRQVLIPHVSTKFNSNGECKDEAILKRIKDLSARLVKNTRLIRSKN